VASKGSEALSAEYKGNGTHGRFYGRDCNEDMRNVPDPLAL